MVIPLPFRIHPVQSKGLYYQDICIDGAFRPGGVDLTGGYVLDVIPVADPVVAGGGIVGNTVVDDDVLGDHYAA